MTMWRLKGPLFLFLAALLCVGCVGMGVSPQDKNRADASLKLAEVYLSEGKTALAMQELLKAQKLNPEDPLIYNTIGMAYINKENFQLAIENFKKALDLKPDYSEARNNLGSAYLGLEQWDNAIPIFKAMIGDVLYTKPHYPLTNLGWAYYNKGDYKTAESYLKEALEMQPDYAIAQMHLGRVYLVTGRLHQARKTFEHVAESNPKNPFVLYEMGRTYRLLGDYKNAILALKGAIEYSEDSELAVKAADELKKVYQ